MAMWFSQARGFALLDLMLSIAAIATGFGVVQGLARFAPSEFLPAGLMVAVPAAYLVGLSTLAVLVRLAGRRAPWEERWVSLIASLWVVMPATIALVMVWALLASYYPA